MNVAKVLERARRIFNCSTSQYTDAQMLDDLNVVKDNLWTSLISIANEWYGWQKWTTNLVAGQWEYTTAEITSTTEWTLKLDWVSVCYNGKMYDWTTNLIYIPCKLVPYNSLKYDWSYYENTQDATQPIYTVKDNSYMIAPLPKTTIGNGIQLTWVRNLVDYTLSTTDLKIPLNYQEILVDGLWPYCYSQKVMKQEEIQARQEYERRRDITIQRLWDRVETPFYASYPWENMADIINPTVYG